MNATTADKLGLSQTTLDKLNSIFRQHNTISLVLIYGSRAKGNYRPGSDIDLTIKGGNLEFAELMQIQDQIDDLYLPYTVDLSHYSQLTNPDLIAHIDRVGVVIYDRDAESDKANAENLAKIKI
jgi:uncharacterized protein